MKAVRLHTYGERPVVDEVAEPEITDPLDVIVRIGGASIGRACSRRITSSIARAGQRKQQIDTPFDVIAD